MNLKLEHGDYFSNIGVLALAYRNVGIQLGYQGKHKEAMKWYQRAHDFLEKHGKG